MKTYTEQHPITPPPELVEELQDIGNLDAITLADQELEACLWHLESTRCNQIVITTLRAARRPPPLPAGAHPPTTLERRTNDNT